ncbi:MAG TPA: response regulator [Bacteroidia bacterium]|nr:response regulator [Bacteroidia bacterium]
MSDKIKILILEDNKSDAELLLYALKKSELNFSYEQVDTRGKFENAIDAFKPDIILSDYNLPSLDGIEAFKIKRSKCPDTPFIIVSGTIGEENAVELIKIGITDYAIKGELVSLSQKITRGLKDAQALCEKRISDKKLKIQNEKLIEIAFLQSHQVRAPIAQIIGLYNLFNFDDYSDPINAEIFDKMKDTAKSLDRIVRDIVQNTSEIREIE